MSLGDYSNTSYIMSLNTPLFTVIFLFMSFKHPGKHLKPL